MTLNMFAQDEFKLLALFYSSYIALGLPILEALKAKAVCVMCNWKSRGLVCQ